MQYTQYNQVTTFRNSKCLYEDYYKLLFIDMPSDNKQLCNKINFSFASSDTTSLCPLLHYNIKHKKYPFVIPMAYILP